MGETCTLKSLGKSRYNVLDPDANIKAIVYRERGRWMYESTNDGRRLSFRRLADLRAFVNKFKK